MLSRKEDMARVAVGERKEGGAVGRWWLGGKANEGTVELLSEEGLAAVCSLARAPNSGAAGSGPDERTLWFFGRASGTRFRDRRR